MENSLLNGNFGRGGRTKSTLPNNKGGTGGGILSVIYDDIDNIDRILSVNNDINCNYVINTLTELGGDGGISYVKQGLIYEKSTRNDSKKNGKVIIEYLGES